MFLFSSINLYAQAELTRILFVFDASNSMNQKWGRDTRLNVAKDILIRTVDSLKGIDNLEIGLRVYGHQSPVTATYQDCEDTKLEVPLGKNNHQFIINKIKSIRAKGTTPIARSLEAAASDFPDKDSRNIIILITDGIEACDDEPCVIAEKLRAKGITISPFVIGLGLDMSYLEHFDCYGQYSSAENEEAFGAVIKNVLNKALVNTTVQINLNNIKKQPLETDVTMFLYEAGTKNLIYTFVHTLNERGLPDTLIIDPNRKYDIFVQTLPVQYKKGVTIKKNQHNIIEIDTPQGFLTIEHKQVTRALSVDIRVTHRDENRTINAQKIGEKEKYIVGEYDLEVLCLPRRYFKVDVQQSSTTVIKLDAPGTLNVSALNTIIAQVFEINRDGELQWVCNLENNKRNQKIELQPGNYRVVSRKEKMKSSTYTVVRDFSIYSNKTITINL